jgi:hypothetical protein
MTRKNIKLTEILDILVEEEYGKRLDAMEKEEAKQYNIWKNPNSTPEEKQKALDSVRKLGSDIQHAVKYGEHRAKPSVLSKIKRAIRKVGEKWTTSSGRSATKNQDGTITYKDK